MRKALIIALFAAAAVAGTVALSTTATASTRCPKNSHLVTCPTYSFCCPNNALCVCL